MFCVILVVYRQSAACDAHLAVLAKPTYTEAQMETA